MRRIPNPYSRLSQDQKLMRLMEAIQAGDTAAVDLILSSKLNINKITASLEQSPLEMACASGNVGIARMLLEKGARPNAAAGQDGPLHLACRRGDAAMARLLLDFGANAGRHGKWGWTPLIHAAAVGRSRETVRLLLQAGSDIRAVDANKENALYRMISEGDPNPEIAELLLESGLDIHENNLYFGTALHWAARCCRGDIVRMLLKKGARVNMKEKREDATPIVWAMEHKCHDAVKILFNHGADPLSADRFGFSLLEYAAGSGDRDLAADVLRALISDPASPKAARLSQAASALTRAVQKDDLEMVRLLVDGGVDLNTATGEREETALMRAVDWRKPEIVKYLLQRGGDVKARDSRGNTALLHAAWCGSAEMVRNLIDSGAQIGETNNLNWNSLMQACSEGHLDTARLLLEKGSPLDVIDHEMGLTALALAEQSRNLQLVELLKSRGAAPRPIHWRQPREPWYSIFDCDICRYLGHAFGLPGSYEPREMEGLDIIHTDVESTDNYTDYTEIIKKCRNCGTWYHHYHYIDTEDAASSGVRESQNIQRYNLLKLKGTLKSLGLESELEELEGRYPGLIQDMEQRFDDHMLGTYILQNLIDYYLVSGNWEKLEARFFLPGDPDTSLAAIGDLAALYGMRVSDRIYPLFTEIRSLSPEVKKAAMPIIKKHSAALKSFLDQWKESREGTIQKLYGTVLNRAREYGLFS